MTATESDTQVLPYLINDADEHSTPALGAYEKYIDPDKTDMAIRMSPGGGRDRRQLLYNGRPARFTFKNFQVVGSNEQLEEVGVKDCGSSDDEGGQVIPGSLLTRLNPLKDLDAEGRKDFAKKYRAMQEQLDNPADRLTVMDSQGIEAAVNFATLPGTEVEFEDDFDGLYANLTALNRYLGTEWGFNYENRLFTPPFISFADPEAALRAARRHHEDRDAESHPDVERPVDAHLAVPPRQRPVLVDLQRSRHQARHAPRVGHPLRGAGRGVERARSDARRHGRVPVGLLLRRPARVRDRRRGDPAGLVRPVPEDAAAALGAGHRVGAVHHPQARPRVPHGPQATWGTLTMRPSDYFKQHCFVAPFPEENVDRVVEAVGIEPIVFGSDFPHGEGLPEPQAYLGQLKNFTEDQVKTVMRGNLARFLDLPPETGVHALSLRAA